ncbi:class I SAM-dependent methyltransferase [Fulvivirgaceae bacterium BMA10]|uniref:Class I SAM-dependent methyltransferase n=1 Tax=Splendidivirga corallicola TaxID=3051826 RepID=A0ABT8KP47_9BACT|nr:class I SAM-dependent methyltransferase [Fulvivirgaceae bacterium BMA10]
MEKSQGVEVGQKTLHILDNADKFNKWMYEVICDHIEGKVLEVGSGIGNISKFFVDDGYDITLSDTNEGYVNHLRHKFHKAQNLKEVLKFDIGSNQFETDYKSLSKEFDSIFSLNVIEHIQDDYKAVSNCASLLKTNGMLVLLVPAFQSLYNRFDQELLHYRRYSKGTLKDLLILNNFEIIDIKYFNFPGIFGWWVSGKLQSNKTIPSAQVKLYDALVPLFKTFDKFFNGILGLSLIAIARKK